MRKRRPNLMSQMMSKLTSKGQATIPAAVRKKLGLTAGDFVAFSVGKGGVTLVKAGRLDAAFLKLAEAVFSDWDSAADDEALRDLQVAGHRRRQVSD